MSGARSRTLTAPDDGSLGPLLRLSVVAVDLPARLAHLRFELFVQTAPEGVLPLLERVLSLPHSRFGCLERLAHCQPQELCERHWDERGGTGAADARGGGG